MSSLLAEALQPLVQRVRTDVTAIRGEFGPQWTRDALTDARLAKHLNGGPARGVCPIKAGENTTMVAVLDLDSHKGESTWDEMVAAADTISGALLMAGLLANPWRSGGGNGVHLIMLWDEPQDAYSVRQALIDTLAECGYTNGTGGIAKGQIEVFPKQDSVPLDGFGNQFFLPLAGKSEPLIPALGYDPGGREAAEGMTWLVSVPVPVKAKPAPPVAFIHAADRGMVDRALFAIPNKIDNRDEWFVLMCAYKEGGGIEELAREWTAQHDSYAPEKFDGPWDSITVGKAGGTPVDHLFRLAEQHGFTEHIDGEFEAAAQPVTLPQCTYKCEAYPSCGCADPVAQPLTEEPGPLPRFDREKSGAIIATVTNAVAACARADVAGARVAYDLFRDEITVSRPGADEWRPMNDADAVDIRIHLEHIGFKSAPKELVRDACVLVAQRNTYDSAILWLRSLKWDGVPRVERFLIDMMGCEDTPYSRAVGLYMWTALAGRVIQPGVKADMVPIYEGDQGLRKSTAIAALAPAPEFFVEVDFETKEEDRARTLRGALVGEIAELSGLHTKAIENIKKFITRTHEKWVPKYREFATTFARRCLFIGTTNRVDILADETGNRRWLPLNITRADVEAIVVARAQLWAEGAALFDQHGVMWQDAEHLAPVQHERYKREDGWEPLVETWLAQAADIEYGDLTRADVPFTTADVLSGALNISAKDYTPFVSKRIGAVLREFGYEQKTARINSKPTRAWVKRVVTPA